MDIILSQDENVNVKVKLKPKPLPVLLENHHWTNRRAYNTQEHRKNYLG